MSSTPVLHSYPFPPRNPNYPRLEDIIFVPALSEKPETRQRFFDRASSSEAKELRDTYLRLEQHLADTFAYITPESRNGDLTSPQYPAIICEAAALYERVARMLYERFYARANINIYNLLALDVHIGCSQAIVFAPAFRDSYAKFPEANAPFRKLRSWNGKTQIERSCVPNWWDAYNNCKHDASPTKGTQANAIAALKAAYILIDIAFGPGVVGGPLVDPAGREYFASGSKLFVTDRPTSHFAVDVFDDAPDPDVPRALEVPASADLLKAANDDARAVYGGDAMSLKDVRRWLSKNPFAIGVLRTVDNRYLGYFDVLPLTQAAAQSLLNGMTERQITPEMIVPPASMDNAPVVYIASIAVKDSRTQAGKQRAAALLLGLVAHMRRYYPKRPLSGLAIAATSDGQRLLKSINATVCRHAHTRSDGHDLYEFQWTAELEEDILRRIRKRLDNEVVPLVETQQVNGQGSPT
jgi:hypothetical protein